MEMETIKNVFDIISICFVIYLIGYSTFLFLSVVVGASTLYRKKMQDRLMNKFTENYFVQISQGSTNQTRLYCSMVKPAELLIPSMDELEKFKNYVHPMRNEIEHRRFENVKLTELQSLLLAKMGQ